jgi:hypothetical protein
LQSEVPRFTAKVPRLQKFERTFVPVENVSTRIQAFNCIDDQIEVIQLRAELEEVG